MTSDRPVFVTRSREFPELPCAFAIVECSLPPDMTLPDRRRQRYVRRPFYRRLLGL